jgi:hypothetical protein
MRWLRLVVALGAVAGCNRGTGLDVGGACDLSQSSDACLQCQARECKAMLDGCYGARFRLGHDLPPCPSDGSGTITLTTSYSNDPRYQPVSCQHADTPRCKWNEATQAYDRDCVSPAGVTDCDPFTQCYQRCGCGAGCARSCSTSMTAGCSACVQKTAWCAATYCARECGSAP